MCEKRATCCLSLETISEWKLLFDRKGKTSGNGERGRTSLRRLKMRLSAACAFPL